jgi:hypothetical protein
MSGLFEKKTPSGVWWRDHSLSLVIAAILIVQTLYALYAGSYVFTREEPFGPDVTTWTGPFWVWWTWEYSISIVADTYGVLLIVLLSKWLREVGSSEDTGSNQAAA